MSETDINGRRDEYDLGKGEEMGKECTSYWHFWYLIELVAYARFTYTFVSQQDQACSHEMKLFVFFPVLSRGR